LDQRLNLPLEDLRDHILLVPGLRPGSARAPASS